MASARIYQPAKTAMQSGRNKTRKWVLEFEPTAKKIDPLMGWTSGDTANQVRMRFDTKEAAVAFAEKHGLDYRVHEPHVRRTKPKSYASKFVTGLTS